MLVRPHRRAAGRARAPDRVPRGDGGPDRRAAAVGRAGLRPSSSSDSTATCCRSSATSTIRGSSATSRAPAPGRPHSATSSRPRPTSTPAPGARRPGPSQLELTVLDWFRDWIGYPAGAAGVLVSGGSAANLTAIACAREALVGPMSPRIVAYTSDQTHSSLARAARHLGFRPDQIRVLPTDEAFRLRPADVAAAMDADVAAGRLPFLVSANAGTTSTGAVDPLPELAAICRERGVWLHVDGAYGAFAVLTERGRAALAGLALADSVTLDPHKWLAMPFEVGCLHGPRRRRPRARVRAPPGVPPGVRGRGTRRQLRRPGPPAHPGQPRDQGLARPPGLRRRRLPRGRSTGRST